MCVINPRSTDLVEINTTEQSFDLLYFIANFIGLLMIFILEGCKKTLERKMFLSKLTIILLLQFFISSWSFATGTADVSILLFKEGKPVTTAKLLVDGQRFSGFSESGAVYGKIGEGLHLFSVLTKENVSFDFELDLVNGENVQALITLFADETLPTLEIESSARSMKNVPKAAVDAKNKASGKGAINARVVSIETGKPIKGVQVYISGVKNKLLTDKDGQFSIEVPVGKYNVSLLHSAFNTRNKDNIEVIKDKVVKLKFSMSPAGVELPEHVVLEPHLAGTLASAIGEQRDTSSVSNVLGSEQISRSGDSDVASALRRASGVTLVNGKFVFIRGLGERYSSTLVNTAPMPSPDSTRRVVPLDLFPTSFLDSVIVQKTYSVDRPAEFAGGTIDMRTRNIPDDFFLQFSGQVAYINGTTFEDGLGYDGGGTDYLGIEDGSRELPRSIAAIIDNGDTIRGQTTFNPDGVTEEELEGLGEDLSGVWDIKPKEIGPDGRMALSMGNSFELGDFNLGFVSSVRWSQKWDIREEVRRNFANSRNNKLILRQDFDVNRTEREVQLDGYIGAEVNYKEDHRFFGKMFVLRQTVDEARITEGFTDAETTDIRRLQLEYIENELQTLQLGSEHKFNFLNDLQVKWLYTTAEASREAPNERRYRYDQQETGEFNKYGYPIPEEEANPWFFSRRADSNQTIYSELEDKDENWRVDVTLPINFTENTVLNIQGGFLDQEKIRESSIRRFNFSSAGDHARDPNVLALQSLEEILVPEYIGKDGFQLLETTRATDNYMAEQSLFAYYGQLDLSLFDMFRVTGGLRWEENDQTITTFELFNPDDEPIVTEVSRTDVLPAITGTWLISENQQLRLGYSETLSRPDFRELSPAPFTDPVNDKETLGNSKLKQTSIVNYDVRWEYYFSESENISLGFFWKDLELPIEKVFLPGPGGVLTYQNADASTLYGFEFEVMKKLGFIWSGLENFYMGGNYTWSESSVELNEENLKAQTTASRPLQGHSANVINIQLGYDNPDWGTTATLLYNTTSERIVEVGLLGTPDKYQQGFNQLDFVYNQKLNEWFTVNFRMKNLLDDTVEVFQGSEVTREYTPGREFKLGLRIDF